MPHGGSLARDVHLTTLSSRSSKHAVTLPKDAGVDMTYWAPLNAAVADTSAVTDQMEAPLEEP